MRGMSSDSRDEDEPDRSSGGASKTSPFSMRSGGVAWEWGCVVRAVSRRARNGSEGSRGRDREDRRRLLRNRRAKRVQSEERLEVVHNLLLGDGKVVVEQVQELLLHEVDLGLREHLGVAAPVLVLGRRVVQVLGGDDERRKEDPVTGAGHALGDLGQAVSKALEVDEVASRVVTWTLDCSQTTAINVSREGRPDAALSLTGVRGGDGGGIGGRAGNHRSDPVTEKVCRAVSHHSGMSRGMRYSQTISRETSVRISSSSAGSWIPQTESEAGWTRSSKHGEAGSK